MKGLVQESNIGATFQKITKWSRLISITGSAQILIQAIALISGILVIRLLPTHEYALYTLANTMLGTMTILADGGISTAVMAQGGKVWDDKDKLGAVLVTGMGLRKKFVMVSLAVSIPLLFFLLRHHGASWLMTVLLLMSLVPAFLTALSNSFLQIAPKLKQDILPLQRNQIEANAGRLIILLTSVFMFPFAFIAILASGIPQIWTNYRLKSISKKYANWEESSIPEVEKEIIAFVKRALPGSIYYCLSGQLIIWLISIFGSTTAVAQIGALSRLAMILNVFNSIFVTLILPRFARLPSNFNSIMRHYVTIQILFFALSFVIVSFVTLFPEAVLFILGKNYSGLKEELVLSAIGSCLTLILGSAYSLFTARGWALNPLIAVSINILAIIVGILIIDVSSLKGILFLNIFIALVELVMYQVFSFYKINRIKAA